MKNLGGEAERGKVERDDFERLFLLNIWTLNNEHKLIYKNE